MNAPTLIFWEGFKVYLNREIEALLRRYYIRTIFTFKHSSSAIFDQFLITFDRYGDEYLGL
jgi:hypothetical protein